MPYLKVRAYVAKGHIGPAYNGEAIVCSRTWPLAMSVVSTSWFYVVKPGVRT